MSRRLLAVTYLLKVTLLIQLRDEPPKMDRGSASSRFEKVFPLKNPKLIFNIAISLENSVIFLTPTAIESASNSH